MQEENIKLKKLSSEDHKYLTFLKKVFRYEFRKNNFRRISNSILDKTSVFRQVFGDNINKKLITFSIEDNTFSFNPLFSILNLKSYIEENKKELVQPIYTYFMDFIYTKGIGKELIKSDFLFGGDVIGVKDIIIDIQNIYIITSIFNNLGIKDYKVNYNFIGAKKEQNKFEEKLLEFLDDKKHIISEENLKLIEDGKVLDIFKNLNEDEKILLENAPKITKFYKKDSKKEFANLSEYLDILDLDFNQDIFLFGDYDFMDGLIWNITDLDGNILVKGYGYTELSIKFGERKEIPATGFWIDIFKIIDKIKELNLRIKDKDKLDLFFVQLGDDAKKVVLPLSIKARQAGIKTATALGTPSMKEQMLKANKSNAKYIVMVGLMEAKTGIFQIRDSLSGKQQEIKKDELIDYLVEKIGKDNLNFFNPIEDLLEEDEVNN